MEETTFIYALINPITNQVRYIGKSDNPDRRYKEHLKDSVHEGKYKRNWVRGLLRKGVIPELLILDEVLDSEWRFWELYYYNLYTSWGFKLINVAICGEGGNRKGCHNKETIAKLRYAGYKTAKFKDGRVRTDEEIAELIELKKNYIKPSISKNIYQIDNTSNNVIEIFKSRLHCTESLGLRINKLDELLLGYQVKSKGVTKKVKQWKGFVFVREADYDSSKDYRVIPRKTIPIQQYDLKNNLIAEFPSIKIATEATGTPAAQICATASPKYIQKTAGGFIWKYLDNN